ncbi:MAG: hypothetical protein KGZ82_07150, partial [Bacteroidales bacterium]|nr:hypothetical protein [Bacteroidales bacterium]
MHQRPTPEHLQSLKPRIRQWALELGFTEIAFASAQLNGAENRLLTWLQNGFHGSMDYMARHGATRAKP